MSAECKSVSESAAPKAVIALITAHSAQPLPENSEKKETLDFLQAWPSMPALLSLRRKVSAHMKGPTSTALAFSSKSQCRGKLGALEEPGLQGDDLLGGGGGGAVFFLLRGGMLLDAKETIPMKPESSIAPARLCCRLDQVTGGTWE